MKTLLVVLLSLSSLLSIGPAPFAIGLPTSCDSSNVTLLCKSSFTIGYSEANAGPAWVAWHLCAGDLGPVLRFAGGFYPDTTAPGYRVHHTDYARSGWDLGHLCPSADRTASVVDNESTFILSNIIPQAPQLNRQVWEKLEQWCRDQVAQGNELYIVAGGASSQGTLAGGPSHGKINIPAYCWKVVLMLPEGADDLTRIDAHTPAFAVLMPNSDTVARHEWTYYKHPIADVETLTGFRFLTNLPASVRAQLID